ncbi:MAG: hypothetical protein O2958_09075 [Gemmatimonadetes bacterium]|nr:hypothetical protein [Gemmatimonadota bacterium]MDA1104700.1 hypothetical protein [Gemmatimonadota bacterium]
MTASGDGPLLTLEPLIEAIREGVEGVGWELSGLQKTTSHQFEGRWEGESTRSAYLFFHPHDGAEHLSVDVYLDETTRGLTGNLALVVDLVRLGEVKSVSDVLRILGRLSATTIGDEHRRPVTLRLRLSDADQDADDATTEVRFKVRIPQKVLGGGRAAVVPLVCEVMASFAKILESDELARLAPPEGDHEG